MANTHDSPCMTFSKILSQKGCDVSEAVKEFSKHINDAADKKSPKVAEDALWSSWRDFSKVVAATKPEDQDCLVQFLLKLRNGEGGEKPLKVWGNGTTLKSLPLFGPEMRYVWNEAPEEGKDTPAIDEKWVNLNAFAARITAVSKPGDSLDYSMYCIWSIRDALEDMPPEKETKPAVLEAAAMWMVYASDEVWRRVVDEQTFDGRSAVAGTAVEGKDWKGYSKERWNFWADRFEKKKEVSEDEATKKIVQRALERMSKAEHKGNL